MKSKSKNSGLSLFAAAKYINSSEEDLVQLVNLGRVSYKLIRKPNKKYGNKAKKYKKGDKLSHLAGELSGMFCMSFTKKDLDNYLKSEQKV